MKKTDRFYLRHILDAINQIREYTAEADVEIFRKNKLLQDGILRQMEIVGEACRNISDEQRDLHPEVPWYEIIGLRNRLVHAYFSV